MNYLLGVDGGGTKTAFVISGLDGVPLARMRRGGCSYQSIGVDAVVDLIINGVRDCLAAVNANLADCDGCCMGVPCYGECAKMDAELVKRLEIALAPMPIYVVNDVQIGWAGALECKAGIHLVSGTGSIAFGCGTHEQTARCGGWSEFFGDEGSCYWVGREAMSLFSKEADGRAPKGALYERVCRELKLEEDFQFTNVVLQNIAPHREGVAGFQQLACDAAQDGDMAAADIFKRAAFELALMVSALQKKLSLPAKAPVSYSGGLFKAGALILQPLSEYIDALGFVLQAPKHCAEEGALILAMQQFKSKI